MDKVSSTLKQLTRDWSVIGKKEREGAYLPICSSLLKEYGSIAEEGRSDIKVLVPGAGLGRLVYDIAKLGNILESIY
jgi:carnosine N-methyltransferase